MAQGLVVASLENHIGDGAALWAPQLYLALDKDAGSAISGRA